MTTESHPSHPITAQPQRTLRIGTRSSALALAQVKLFTSLLSSSPTPSPNLSPTPLASIPTTTHALSTNPGDTNKSTPLHTLASSGKSLWTESLETELLDGKLDCIIHSLKDVPTKLPHGCRVRAVGKREEKRDCVLVAPKLRGQGEGGDGVKGEGAKRSGLGRLKQGAVVGTSSVRRAAMIRRNFPGLVIKDVRGNVPTRIRKLEEGEYDALILAGAGVQRLGLDEKIDGWLGWEQGVGHAVGQGALGVEWREGDEWVEGILRALETGLGREGKRVAWEGEAERGLLRVLEGGCSVPVGVECVWDDEERGEEGKGNGGGWLTLKAMVVSTDGEKFVEAKGRRLVGSDEDANACGLATAKELIDKGAGDILKEIELNRGMIRGQDNA